MECLVIVDMQYRFSTANDKRTIKNVIGKVIRAKAVDMPIIVLEYRDYFPTYKSIVRTIGDYPLATTEIKYTDDGSKEVVKGLHRLGLSIEDIDVFHVCGVNYSACVASTVIGLLKKKETYQEIVVSQKTCNCYNPRKKEDWNDITEHLIMNGITVTN